MQIFVLFSWFHLSTFRITAQMVLIVMIRALDEARPASLSLLKYSHQHDIILAMEISMLLPQIPNSAEHIHDKQNRKLHMSIISYTYEKKML